MVPHVTARTAEAHHFYISGIIRGANKYVDLLQTLREAGPQDEIYLHLNTPGGSLYTTAQIITGMRQCRGTVITCAEGLVASAGSAIFLSGHALVVEEFCSFMAHDCQSVEVGSLAESTASIAHATKIYQRMVDSVYTPFLTKAEVKSIKSGGTVWLDAPALQERIVKASKKIAKEAKRGLDTDQ